MGNEAEELSEFTSAASLVTGEDLDDALDDEHNMEALFDAAVSGVDSATLTPTSVEVEKAPTDIVEDPAAPVAIAGAETATPTSVEISEKSAAAVPDQIAEMQATIDALKKDRDDQKSAEAAATVAAEEEAGSVEDTYVDPATTLSEADQEALRVYTTDWPEIAAGEKINRDMMASRIGTIIHQMTNYFETHIAALTAQIGQMSSVQETTALNSKVENYDAVASDIRTWVDAQPHFLKPGYLAVLDSGTPEEKLELVELYKSTIEAPVATVTTAPVKKPSTAGLEPVITKRGVKPNSHVVDQDDMDGAFKEATAALGKK